MNSSRAVALQMCPFSEQMEAGLARRFEVLKWYQLSNPEQGAWLLKHAARVQAIVTGGHVGCTNELIQALPQLGIIAINGVGVDKVDLGFAGGRNVRVTTTPGVLTEDVADLAVGLIISLLRQVAAADAYVRAGRWLQGDRPLARKVSGRRFGIVGLGNIGSAIAARLAAFGPVAYTSRQRKPVAFEFHSDVLGLARASDVLVLSCSANASTRHLVGSAVIDALGPEGYLVNVARGSIVDEAVLSAALASGKLAGAALDVFENEPNVPESLRASDKVVLTPHVASATVEGRRQMAELVLANLDAFTSSAPKG
jgi:lactate dehydrogenase-like 2-hydroxyacid dehydrogenase